MQTLTSQLTGDKIIKRGRWIIRSEALMNTHEAFRSQLCVVRWVSGERGRIRDSDKYRKAKWWYVLVGGCLLPLSRWTLLAELEHYNSAFTLSFFILSCGGVSEKNGLVWHEDGGPCLTGWSLHCHPDHAYCTTERVNAQSQGWFKRGLWEGVPEYMKTRTAWEKDQMNRASFSYLKTHKLFLP